MGDGEAYCFHNFSDTVNDAAISQRVLGAANEPPSSAAKACERLSELPEWRRASAFLFPPPVMPPRCSLRGALFTTMRNISPVASFQFLQVRHVDWSRIV